MFQNSLLISKNSANSYAVIYLISSKLYSQNLGHATFLNNLGSLVTFDSNITFAGYVMFMNNRPPQNPSVNLQGGVITLFESNAFFEGTCNFVDNHASNGGAISSTESKLYISGNATVAQNMATQNRGGVYLYNSEMNVEQKSAFVLFNNTAIHKGGGVHAISSTITTTSAIKIYLTYELGYKVVYMLDLGCTSHKIQHKKEVDYLWKAAQKSGIFVMQSLIVDFNSTIFAANVADYGGACSVCR